MSKPLESCLTIDTIVPVEFARQLETELADKDKQLADAQKLIKKLRRWRRITCKH